MHSEEANARGNNTKGVSNILEVICRIGIDHCWDSKEYQEFTPNGEYLEIMWEGNCLEVLFLKILLGEGKR